MGYLKKTAITITSLTLLSGSLGIIYWNELSVERKVLLHSITDYFYDHQKFNLMVGSSTIERIKLKSNSCGEWLNRGIGASTIADNLNYLRMSSLSLQPSYILVYVGENDLYLNQDLTTVKNSFKTLINELEKHYKQAKIFLIPLKPAPKRKAIRISITHFNTWLYEFANKQPSIEVLNIHWLDHDKELLFLQDNLHLTPLGYDLIFKSLDIKCIASESKN